jgi:hypothetical protein
LSEYLSGDVELAGQFSGFAMAQNSSFNLARLAFRSWSPRHANRNPDRETLDLWNAAAAKKKPVAKKTEGSKPKPAAKKQASSEVSPF